VAQLSQGAGLGRAPGPAGFPPMPARVFVALLIAEDGRLSAAELAERLRISPAAVSGAVRLLTRWEKYRAQRDR
jgi:predicted ArsR family transcriptional regulator